MKRKVLYCMIDKENASYNLYNNSNDIVLKLKEGDVLFEKDNKKWVVVFNTERDRFFINLLIDGEVKKDVLLPARTNICWAMDSEAMEICPYTYMNKYNNCLEKWLIYNNFSKDIIVYHDKEEPIKYQIFIKNNIPAKIDIYTGDKRVYKEIVKELKERIGVG